LSVGSSARSLDVAVGLASAACALFFGVPGCQQPREHPAALPQCDGGPGCVEPPPLGSGGATGADRVVEVPADQRTNVTAEVMRITREDFTSTSPFGEPVEIRAEGAGGVEVVAQSDGTNPVELENVAVGPQVWFGVFPTNPASVDAMPTIEPLDTRVSRDVELHVIAGSVLDQIYDVLTNPTTRAPGAAQVVLRFVLASDRTRPVSGVSVHADNAETFVYDAAGSYSDVTGATGPAGVAIVANLAAGAVARDVPIAISGPVSTLVEARVLAGAVTFGEVPLTF